MVVAFAGGIALGLVLFVLLRPGLGLEGLLGSPVDLPLAVEPVHLAALLVVMAAVIAIGIALGARFQGGARAALALRRGME